MTETILITWLMLDHKLRSLRSVPKRLGGMTITETYSELIKLLLLLRPRDLSGPPLPKLLPMGTYISLRTCKVLVHPPLPMLTTIRCSSCLLLRELQELLTRASSTLMMT